MWPLGWSDFAQRDLMKNWDPCVWEAFLSPPPSVPGSSPQMYPTFPRFYWLIETLWASFINLTNNIALTMHSQAQCRLFSADVNHKRSLGVIMIKCWITKHRVFAATCFSLPLIICWFCIFKTSVTCMGIMKSKNMYFFIFFLFWKMPTILVLYMNTIFNIT